MLRKIKKYIKFIMCFMLIFCLTFSSYAALSSSDGSIFVTKTELNTTLTEYNARLATFETGINSKIDTQVTSYLDTNGIWNGTVQNISYPKNTNVIMSANCVKMVSNMTKSGMLYLPWIINTIFNAGFYISSNGSRSAGSITVGQGSPVNMDFDTVAYFYNMPQTYTNDSYAYDTSIFDPYQVYSQHESLNLVTAADSGNSGLQYGRNFNRNKMNVSMFFVSKDCNLFIRFKQDAKFSMNWWGITGTKTNAFVTSNLVDSYGSNGTIKFYTGSGWKFQWNIWDDVKIY